MIVIFWSNCSTMKTVLSMMESYKDQSLVAPFLLGSRFFTYIYIYIYFSTIHSVYLHTFYTLLHSILLQRAERVLYKVYRMNVPYERTVHTFITYIAPDCLFERPRSLVREIYGSPHIPILELLFHFSIVPFGV